MTGWIRRIFRRMLNMVPFGGTSPTKEKMMPDLTDSQRIRHEDVPGRHVAVPPAPTPPPSAVPSPAHGADEVLDASSAGSVQAQEPEPVMDLDPREQLRRAGDKLEEFGRKYVCHSGLIFK